jgi:catechol 2,3-dioxygenase-like lactoylglutathione lyase family enzyme
VGLDQTTTPGISVFADRPIFQIAFVVRDLDEALARYTDLFGPSEWRLWTFGRADHDRCEHRGEPADFITRLALNDKQPQLEVIQPLTESGPHHHWLRERGEGPHSVGIVVDSVADVVARAADDGYETVASGSGIGAAGDGAWGYIDTSDVFGLMVEAVEPPTNMPPPEGTRRRA